MIRTGLIGYGRNGQAMHGAAIRKSPEFEMTCVCDIDKKATDLAKEVFGCDVCDDYHDLLARDDLDLVVIVTPSDLHAKMACDALAAGKNVLVTKPWGINMDEVDSMIAAQKKSGKILMPWLPARWGSDIVKLREVVASGVIGDVFQIVRSQFTFGKRNDWQIYASRGGGYLLNWGPHIVDQAMILSGGEPVEISAFTKQIINPGDAEDVFYALMRMDNGIMITAQYNISTSRTPNWVVRGTKGTIIMDGNKLTVDSITFPDVIPEGTYRCDVKTDTYTEDVKGNVYGDTDEVYTYIADTVKGIIPYPVPLDEARRLSYTLEKIRESANSGKSVSFR